MGTQKKTLTNPFTTTYVNPFTQSTQSVTHVTGGIVVTTPTGGVSYQTTPTHHGGGGGGGGTSTPVITTPISPTGTYNPTTGVYTSPTGLQQSMAQAPASAIIVGTNPLQRTYIGGGTVAGINLPNIAQEQAKLQAQEEAKKNEIKITYSKEGIPLYFLTPEGKNYAYNQSGIDEYNNYVKVQQANFAKVLPSGEVPVYDKQGFLTGIESKSYQQSMTTPSYINKITADYKKYRADMFKAGYDPDTGMPLPKAGTLLSQDFRTDEQRFVESIKQNFSPYGLVTAGYEYGKEKAGELAEIGTFKGGGAGTFDIGAGIASAMLDVGYSASLLATNPLQFVKGGAGMVGKAFTEGFPEVSQIIQEKPGYALGYALGTYGAGEAIGAGTEFAFNKAGELIERSPTALKLIENIKASEPLTAISGYAKSVKTTPIWKTIAYEESAVPKFSEFTKAIKEGFKKETIESGLKGSASYAEYMTFKNTLTKSLTEQELASQAFQSGMAKLRENLKSAGVDISEKRAINTEIFAEENRLIQSHAVSEANIQKQTTGATALASEPGFVEKRTELFGARKTPEEGGGFVGDVEFALRGVQADIKKLQLSTEETPTTLKAKTQLAKGGIFKKTIEEKKILNEEKEFLNKKLNLDLDMDKLIKEFGLSKEQQFLLEKSGALKLKVKGSTISKLRKIQSYQEEKGGVLTKEQQTEQLKNVSFLGKDIDTSAKTLRKQLESNKQIIESYNKEFGTPFEEAKQMKIKYKGVAKAEIGELTDYTGKGKVGKPPVGSLTETPTGKVYQIGEAVQFDIKELLKKQEDKLAKTQEEVSRVLPQTKGGAVDIYLSRFFAKGMKEPIFDISVENNKFLKKLYERTKGEEVIYETKQGKKIITVKQIFQEYENFDRVQNALTYEQIEKGAKHILESLKERRYSTERTFKVKAKGAEAYSAEKALQFSEKGFKITLEKEGDRFVISKVPEKIAKGTEPADVVLKKEIEYYNKKVFPELLTSPTEYAEFAGKKVAVQSHIGGKSSKSLAASVRDKYYGEFGKDIKDEIAGKALDIEKANKWINQVQDKGAVERFNAQLNKLINLAYESEGRLPISSKLDLPGRYVKSLLSFEKSEKLMKYEPLTEKQFYEAQKLKVNLNKESYNREQLKNVLSNAIDGEVSVGDYPKIANRAFNKIEQSVGNKEVLSTSKAQKVINNVLKDIQGDISNAKKGASNLLQEEIEKGAYAKVPKEQYPYKYIVPKEYGYAGYATYPKYPSYPKYQKYEQYNKINDIPYQVNKYNKQVENYMKQESYTQVKSIPYNKPPYQTPQKIPPYQPPYSPPIKIIIPKITPIILRKETVKIEKKQSLGAGYDVYGKQLKSNKFIKINTAPLTKDRAKDVGSYYVSQTLARTFRIQASGKAAQEDYQFMYIPSDYFKSKEATLREYRISKKQVIGTPEQFIQKRPFILSSEAEKQQIKEFRKLASQIAG